MLLLPMTTTAVTAEPTVLEAFFYNTDVFRGFYVNCTNTGDVDATNVTFTFTFKGLIYPRSVRGIMGTIPSGKSYGVGIHLWMGFGIVTVSIAIKADNTAPVDVSARYFMVGSFTILLK